MPDPHPIELRSRVVDAYEAGEGTYTSLADRFAVGVASVKRWVWRARDGQLEPSARGGGTPSRILKHEIEEILERLKDANAGEITAEYNRSRRGRSRVHVSSVKRALHRFGYVVKKNASARRSSYGPTSRRSGGRS